MGIEDLKKQLKALQEKREEDTTIKNLKKQIRGEKFAQTRGGKVFNKIADIGDAGFRATGKFLAKQEQKAKGKKKKVKSVKEIMAGLPQ